MLASFDVGTKHLAICVLEGTEVKLWEVLDLIGETPKMCTKEGCAYSAKFMQGEKSYCKRCAKSVPVFHSLQPHTRGNIRSQKLASLRELLESHCIEAPKTKAECVKLSQNLISTQKFFPIAESKKKSVSLPTLGVRLMQALDTCLSRANIQHSEITKVAIENQLGPIASTMKAVQGMVTQYWIMRGVPDVVYVSAANKLKPFTSASLTYKQRKKLAIEKTVELLADGPSSSYSEFFSTSKKKDDLADAYLQGLWVMQSK